MIGKLDSSGAADQLSFDVTSLLRFNEDHTASVINYSFTQGDRATFEGVEHIRFAVLFCDNYRIDTFSNGGGRFEETRLKTTYAGAFADMPTGDIIPRIFVGSESLADFLRAHPGKVFVPVERSQHGIKANIEVLHANVVNFNLKLYNWRVRWHCDNGLDCGAARQWHDDVFGYLVLYPPVCYQDIISDYYAVNRIDDNLYLLAGGSSDTVSVKTRYLLSDSNRYSVHTHYHYSTASGCLS